MKTYFIELDEQELKVIQSLLKLVLNRPKIVGSGLQASMMQIVEDIKFRVDKLLEAIENER